MGILLFISSSSSYLVLFKCRRSRDSQLRIARLADEDQSRYDVTVHAREHGKCGLGVHLHSKSTIDRCLWLAILQGEKSSNTSQSRAKIENRNTQSTDNLRSIPFYKLRSPNSTPSLSFHLLGIIGQSKHWLA